MISRTIINATTSSVVYFSLSAFGAQAQGADSFYRGKSMTLLVGAAPGGGYDVTARMVARHMGAYIPGTPSFIVKNMPGANSLPMTNYLYNVSAKDGTEIGAPNNGIPFEPLLNVLSKDGSGVKFDPLRLNWIGNPVQETYLLFSWHTTPFKTFDDLSKEPMLVGSMGPNADNTILPSILSQVTGAKFRIVQGYQGQSELLLAMERGEINGAGGIGYNGLVSTKPDWIRGNKINILAQFGMTHHPDLTNVPLAIDLVQSPEDRDILRMIFAKYRLSRPLVAPPDVPRQRVELLRQAFDATMKDSNFLKEAKNLNIDIVSTSGEEIDGVIRDTYATAPDLVKKAKRLVMPPM